MLAVLWMKDPDSNKKFVLQENDPGEIQWDQFSLPELKNFLLILDREEAWYKRRCKILINNILSPLKATFCLEFTRNMRQFSRLFMNCYKRKD